VTGPELTAALLEAARLSFDELAASLDLEAPTLVGPVADLPSNGAGAVIPLVGTASFQLGIFGEGDSCDTLAKGVLGIGPDDAADPNDVADAVCEAVNVIAGAAKVKLTERIQNGFELKLGLPLYMRGHTHAFRRVTVAGCEVTMQSRPIRLLVISG
jgi:hypothetical protein